MIKLGNLSNRFLLIKIKESNFLYTIFLLFHHIEIF